MDNYKVYIHTNPLDNNKKYCGITKQKLSERWRKGEGYKGQYFYSIIQEYGWDNLIHETIYSNLSWEEASKIESDIIISNKLYLPEYGYNVKKRDGSYVFSGVSVVQYDLEGNKINEYHSLIDAEKETGCLAQNIVAVAQGKRYSIGGFRWAYKDEPLLEYDFQAKPIDVYDIEGNYIATYPNQSEAARVLGLKQQYISKCCNGNQFQSQGFRFAISGKDLYFKQAKQSCGKRKVDMYDLNDNYLQTFNSQAEALKFLGKTSTSRISECCTGKSKTAYGYKWKYHDKEYENET